MADATGDFIDLPGSGAGAPVRRVALPIERSVAARGPDLAVVLVALLLCAAAWLWVLVATSSGDTGALICAGPSIPASAECHRRYIKMFLLAVAASVVAVWLVVAAVRRSGTTIRILGKVRIDRESFWCMQLAEPILFANVAQATRTYFRGTMTGLSLALRAPPNLAVGKPEFEESTGRSIFYVRRLGVSDDDLLLDVVEFLSDKRNRTPRNEGTRPDTASTGASP